MGMSILSYSIQLVIPNVYTKFKNPRCSSFWEIIDKNFNREKDKWTNIGKDEHEDADSVLHDTSSRIKCLYQLLKS